MKKFIVIASLALNLIALPAAAKGWQVGKVWDGDTIGVYQPNMPWVTIRLAGIDAPEKDQPGADAAREALAGLLKGCGVEFTPIDGDKYGRTVARVTACGVDVNLRLVEHGHAWMYRHYSKDSALNAAETKAKAAKIGIWSQSDPTPPWEWRHKTKP